MRGRARTAAEAFGCRAADSLDTLLDDSDVEAVLVVTPNHTHAEIAVAAAERGRHVFVEKPIADSLADGLRAVEASQRAGVLLFVGHSFRRLGAARAAATAIAEGALGEIVLAEANFSLPGAFSPGSWRSRRETLPAGPMTQLGVHHVDTLQAWIGPAVSVMGSMTHMAAAAEIDDVAVALLEHASGARSVISCSYVSPKTYRIRVYGTRANLDYRTEMSIWPEAERMDEATTLTIEDATGSADLPFEPCDMLVDELEEFARCIRTGAPPETGARGGFGRPERDRGRRRVGGERRDPKHRGRGGRTCRRSSPRRRCGARLTAPGACAHGSSTASAVGGMTLERITLEPGARGPEIVGKAAECDSSTSSGVQAPRESFRSRPESMVWIEAGDRLRLLAGDEGLEVLVAGADAPADP